MRILILILALTFLIAGCANQANSPHNSSASVTSQSVTKTDPSPPPTKDLPASDSLYTDLSDSKCKEMKLGPDDEGAIFKAECPGVAGYKVFFSASDHSQVLSLTDPKGVETVLGFRNALNTVADFLLGDKIEWRMDGTGDSAFPRALIVRVNKFPDPENKDKVESKLAVVKLSGTPCITNIVEPSADQNKQARALADTSKNAPCLKGS